MSRYFMCNHECHFRIKIGDNLGTGPVYVSNYILSS